MLSGDVADGETDKISDINKTVTVVVSEKATTPPSTGTNTSNPTTPTQNPTQTPTQTPAQIPTQTPSKSSDATLKEITVNGQNYSIGTTKTVGYDVSSVTIKATPNNSKTTITGTGTKELVTGTNLFELKSTAEDRNN